MTMMMMSSGEIVTFLTFFFYLLLLLALVTSSVESQDKETKEEDDLKVIVYRVFATRAEIDWFVSPQSSLDLSQLTSCELIYGPALNSEQVQVLPDVVPDRHRQMIELFDLDRNVTYRFQMVCYDLQQRKYVSNRLLFTTDTTVKQKFSFRKGGGDSTVSSTTGRRRSFPVTNNDDDNDSDDPSRGNKNNVVLGATCGIVGFLIINVTIVMGVKQYSHWRMRQRRLYALQPSFNKINIVR